MDGVCDLCGVVYRETGTPTIDETLSKWHEEGLLDYEEACLGQLSEDQ